MTLLFLYQLLWINAMQVLVHKAAPDVLKRMPCKKVTVCPIDYLKAHYSICIYIKKTKGYNVPRTTCYMPPSSKKTAELGFSGNTNEYREQVRQSLYFYAYPSTSGSGVGGSSSKELRSLLLSKVLQSAPLRWIEVLERLFCWSLSSSFPILDTCARNKGAIEPYFLLDMCFEIPLLACFKTIRQEDLEQWSWRVERAELGREENLCRSHHCPIWYSSSKPVVTRVLWHNYKPKKSYR